MEGIQFYFCNGRQFTISQPSLPKILMLQIRSLFCSMNPCQLWAQKCLSEIKLNCQLHSIQPSFSHSQPLIYFSEGCFLSSELSYFNNNVQLVLYTSIADFE